MKGVVATERRRHGDLLWVIAGQLPHHGRGRLQGTGRFHGHLQVLMATPFILGLGRRHLGLLMKVEHGAHPLLGVCLARRQETPCDHSLHWMGHLPDTLGPLARFQELNRLLQEGAAVDAGRGGARVKSPTAASVDVGEEKAGKRVNLKVMQEQRVLVERGEDIVTKMERALVNLLQRGTQTIHIHVHLQQDLRSPRATQAQQVQPLKLHLRGPRWAIWRSCPRNSQSMKRGLQRPLLHLCSTGGRHMRRVAGRILFIWAPTHTSVTARRTPCPVKCR
mmetsp:Transcript_4888/g.9553  ORF Transcript_4888/g.9553 Transcript_4888/m.9553 type:complete len:278 (-) Transcript_4888:151-984(-)